MRPRHGVTYRCHVCRLELVVDRPDGRFVLAPLGPGEADHGHELNELSTANDRAAPPAPRKRRPS